MARLYEKATGTLLGEVSDADLQVMIDQMEEESSEDTDYYINPDTITLLQSQGASEGLVRLLKMAIEGKEEGEVRWERA